MKTIENLIHSTESLNVPTENKDLIAIRIANAKSYRNSTMLHNEMHNSSEQNYYNKANGCSVRAQKDNLFDYYSFLDI